MKITDLITTLTIDTSASATSKEDVLKQAVKLISKSGCILDVDKYQEGVFKREEESTTGIGEGIAIPHCKSDVVTKPAVAAMVLKDGVDFDSLDGEKVHLLFLIAAPNSSDNVHLDVLSRLSQMLLDEDFKNKLMKAKTKKEFLKVIDEEEQDKIEEQVQEDKVEKTNHPDILAVTGCPNGIAHTYMAEDNLKSAAKELGYSIKVETNGSGGVKNLLTDEEIENAKGIIVAADIQVETARFNGKRVVYASVADGISKSKALITRSLDPNVPVQNPEEEAKKTEQPKNESVIRQIYKHLMSGISHMLPFVIGGGILIALAFLIDTLSGHSADTSGNFGSINPVAAWFKTIGGWGMNFMLPILAGYIAYSIAGRPGLAVGVVGGYIATQSTFSISYSIDGVDRGSAGFLGAIAAGFLAGYIIKLLQKGFSWMPKSMEGLKPMLVYPVCGLLLVGLGMYLLNTPFAYINLGVNNALNWLNEMNLVLVLCALLAGMMAIDMGGPINKAAYVFGTGMLTSALNGDLANPNAGYMVMAAVMIGGMIPPLGIAVAANLFPQKFTKQERKDAMVNYAMGFSFITEGAIPYAAKDPLRVIPSCVVGSLVAGLLSGLFGCTLMAPHGGLFVIVTIGNWYWYLLSIVVGTFATAFMLGLLKKDEENPELTTWKGIRFNKRK